MVRRIVVVVFSAAIALPLLVHFSRDRPSKLNLGGTWSAVELDQAYSEAVASAHVRREKAVAGPPLMVAGMTRVCLKEVPEYDGCNHREVLEAVRVCAGSDGTMRLHDNREQFPFRVRKGPRRSAVEIHYLRDMMRDSRAGWLAYEYAVPISEEECARRGGKQRNGRWEPYAGCTVNHEENCQGAAPNKQ